MNDENLYKETGEMTPEDLEALELAKEMFKDPEPLPSQPQHHRKRTAAVVSAIVLLFLAAWALFFK